MINRMRSLGQFAAVALGGVTAAVPVYAGEPCTPAWTTVSEGTGTTDNIVCCSAVASNGDVYFGGTFTQVEGVAAKSIVRWDGTAFFPLGAGLPVGLNFALNGIAILSNGEVLAPDGTGISRWNGSSWSSFGGPIVGTVLALAILPSGDIVAGGSITSVGGVAVNGIARWDGSSWHALGSGATGGTQPVRTLKVLSNGDLLVGGTLTSAGGVSDTRGVARWNAVDGWSALGTGLGSGGTSDSVNCVAELSNGDLVAGGTFGGINIARWDGATWSPLGGGLPGSGTLTTGVWVVTVLSNDDLLVGGQFTAAGGNPTNRIARWNGSEWAPFEPGQTGVSGGSPVRCLVLVPDEYDGVLIGGQFTMAGGLSLPRIARFGCPIPVEPECAADFNEDNVRDVADLFAYINAWLAKTSNADFNDDTVVDVADLFAYINAWLAGC